MKRFAEIYGWYGAVAMITAYGLVSFDILSATSIWYQFLNITAALGIVTISLYKRTYQPAVLNLVWAAIAAVAIVQLLL